MNITQYFPAIAASIYLGLLVVTASSRPWSRQQKLFLIVLIAAACWSTSDFLLRSPFFENHKLWLFRVVIVTSTFWIVQFYYFCRTFLNLPRDNGVYFGYAMMAILAALGIAAIIPPSLNVTNGEVHLQYGLWSVLWAGPIIILFILGVVALTRKLRTPLSPGDRNKIGYLIWAIVLLAALGIPSFTPLARIVPLASIGGILCATVLAYAVVKHELVSISVFLRRLLGWLSLFAISVGVFEVVLAIGHLITGLQLTSVMMIASVIGTLIVTALLLWLRPFFLEKIDQLFFRERYKDRKELLDFVARRIRGVVNLKELGQGLLSPLARTLDCQQVYILLPEKETGNFSVRFSEPKVSDIDLQFQIKGDSPILSYLRSQYLTKKDFDIRPELRGVWTEERSGLNTANIELLFPLLNRGNMVGILALGRKRSGKYSVDDANLVESIAGQVAVSLEKEHFQSELTKREKELSVINRLTRVITSSLNIQDVYDSFIQGLRETVDIDIATIGLLENDQLQFAAVYNKDGFPWRTGDAIVLKGSGLEWVALNKKSLVYVNSGQDEKGSAIRQCLERGINSVLALPLITQGEVIGILTLASHLSGAYNPDQVRLLEQLASQISTSVVNSQLYSSAENRARIDELTGLSNRRHFDETIDKEIQRHFRYGSTLSMILIDVDQLKAYNDLLGHLKGDKLLKKVGQIIKHNARDIDMNFRYGGDEFAILLPSTSVENAVAVAERIRLSVEIEAQSENIPFSLSLGVAGWPNDGITPQDLITASDQALYHAKVTGKNRICTAAQMLPSSSKDKDNVGKESHIEKDTLNAIYALASTIEARDLYTYGHSRKVRSYAVELAEAIGLPAPKVAVVSHAALLHDIGKIGIYDNVLNKPDILTDEERDIIKAHPELSRTIVAHIPDLTPCLPAILHHHERWDGTGYPYALKGEKIPLEARILAIADSFDAMTSARPYRRALPTEIVIDELKRYAGTQFDPELIEAFLPIAIKVLNALKSDQPRELPAASKQAR